MRRGLAIIATVSVTMVIALGLTWVPELMENAEFFHVTSVEVEGLQYLDESRVHELLALAPGASVWGDLDVWAARVRRHVLVEDVTIQRRLPGGLQVAVVERRPVALRPTPVLMPVDREGRTLPVDPTLHRLDLPLLIPPPRHGGNGAIRTAAAGGVSGRSGAGEAAGGDPVLARALAREAARLSEADPGFMARVSEVGMDAEGDIFLRLTEPRTVIHYRGAASPEHLRRSLRIVDHAREVGDGEVPWAVDLRFDGRVIVRFADAQGRL
ncbi:MAG: FtsQ-type POTRA domain-containing protein [Gemmatimonadales bacterium]|nr:MAG: FtsQ-type POTRA domain-containing protein [Gemmatimonadales bacterium]